MSMSEDDTKRDDENRDDADAQAILARRRMFVASALAGLTVSAAAYEACEGSVSGSASINGSVSTGGTSTTSGPQPCLMVSSVDDNNQQNNGSNDSADAGYTIVQPQPCLMVIEPAQTMDSGVRDPSLPCNGITPINTTQGNTGTPTLPRNGGSMPCLSMPAPRGDAGVVVTTHPAPCLEIAGPVVAGNTVNASRDAGAPQPCLRFAYRPDSGVNTGTLVNGNTNINVNGPRVGPVVMPQPCLTPVRKQTEDTDE